MPNVVQHPTPEILKATDLIDQGLAHFIEARFTVPQMGKWEAEVEAMLLLNMVIRYIEAILELSRIDLVLLPGANVLARAVFEVAIKSAWMVQPSDPYDREVRWVAHVKDDARLNEQVTTRVTKSGGDPRMFQERGATLRDFANKVAAKLPAGYSELPGNPSVESMLEDIGTKHMYPIYSILSAYIHGGHASTGHYRKHLGRFKEFGEFTSPAEWYLPLWSSWSTVHFLGQYVLEHLGASKAQFVSSEEAAAINLALSTLSSKVSGAVL